MRNPFERSAPSAEREESEEDPKRREASRLKPLSYQSPAARYLVAGMLALSSEGCAAFKPVVQGLTLESGPVGGHHWEFRQGKESVGFSVEPTFEKRGDAEWWNKPDGIYLPPGDLERWRQFEEEQKIGVRKAQEDAARRDGEGRDALERRKTEAEREVSIPAKSWVTFDADERKPNEPVVYMHPRPNERVRDAVDRGLKLMLATQPAESGVRIRWRDVVRIGVPVAVPPAPRVIAAERGLEGRGTSDVEGRLGTRGTAMREMEQRSRAAVAAREEEMMLNLLRRDMVLRGTFFPKKGAAVPAEELRASIPGAWMWREDAWKNFLDEQRLNEALSISASQERQIAYRMSPLVDTPSPQRVADTLEERLEDVAFDPSVEDGLGLARDAEGGGFAQAVVLARRPIPSIENPKGLDLSVLERPERLKLSKTELAELFALRAKRLEMVRLAKRSAILAAAEQLSPFGLSEMRFHVRVSPDGRRLAVIAATDHPRIPGEFKPET